MKTLLRNNARFVFYIFLIVLVRGSFADQNYVPSGSMEPTIHVGDAIYVDKMAYDIKFPMTGHVIKHLSDPSRGDIVVFFNPKTDVRMVKRVIGLPGDHVRVVDGFATINGQPLGGDVQAALNFANSAQDEMVYLETVGGHHAHIRRTRNLARYEDLDFVIPPHKYFAMGDNRDNSWDSRGWGFIPRENIAGRARGVIYNVSWNPLPSVEWERFFSRLD
jgi:signal peptidase I